MPFRCKEHPKTVYNTPQELRGHFITQHKETGSVEIILTKYASILDVWEDEGSGTQGQEARTARGGKPTEEVMAQLLELQLEEAKRRNAEYAQAQGQQRTRQDQYQAEVEAKARRAESFDDISRDVGNAIIKKNLMGVIDPPPPPVDTAPPETDFMGLIGDEGKKALKETITNRILGKDQKEPWLKVDNEFVKDITKSVDSAIDKWDRSNERKAKIEYERQRLEEARRELEARSARLQQAFNFMVVFEQKFGRLSPDQAMALMDRYMGESHAPLPASAQPPPQAPPSEPPAPEQAPAQPPPKEEPKPPQQSGAMPSWEEAGKEIKIQTDEETDFDIKKIADEVKKEVETNGKRTDTDNKKGKGKGRKHT